eukprot:5664260-Pyramimonas_sp.AAC.1
MTSRCVREWEFVKNEKGEMERAIRLRLALRGIMDLRAFDVEAVAGASRRPSQIFIRKHGSVQEAMDHCFPRP